MATPSPLEARPRSRRQTLTAGAGVGLVAILLIWAVKCLAPPATPAAWLGPGAWVGMVTFGWWLWWRAQASGRHDSGAELARVLGVLAVSIYVMLPMFTDRPLGGVDARWYAHMMGDFIDQWRRDGPPVFIGQGELAWNGGVHPFRSAPVYLHVAGLWDWMTAGTLGIRALQHLTAITAAVAAGWGMYAAGVKLAPERRWSAAAIAALYVASPGGLLPLYVAEAYMTYMAYAVFVLVGYGNARLLVDGRGWIALAAGLSLAWMSHPPTAMQWTLATMLLQVGAVTCGKPWGPPFRAGVLFLLLSAYYWAGMSELPVSAASAGLRTGLLQLAGLLLGGCAILRVFLLGRSGYWALLLLPAGGILWLACRPWLGWLGLVSAQMALLGVLARRRRWSLAGHAPLILLAGFLVAAFAMDAIFRARLPAEVYPEASRQWRDAWAANYFRPLTPALNAAGDLHPDLGLWLAGLVALVAAFRGRDSATQWSIAALACAGLTFLHLPGAGEFAVEYLPGELRAMAGLHFTLRTMPVFVSLLAISAVLGWRVIEPGPWARLATAGLFAALSWSLWQDRLILQHGLRVTATAADAAIAARSENTVMDRFVYDLLPTPRYFSDGKMDPRLEVRLLDDAENLIHGPADIARAMEEGGAERFGLVARVARADGKWFRFEPGFTLQPGEHRLLRFEFDPRWRAEGFLLFFSEHGRREYLLPWSGHIHAFGSGPEQSRVISLWNSGETPEHYYLEFAVRGNCDLVDGGHFADLVVSRYDAARAGLAVESMHPWRIRMNLPWSGQLETPRIRLPGYEVKVDGRRVGPSRVSTSSNGLLQVAMPPGDHVVELHFVGTTRLRVAGLISLAAWLAIFAGGMLRGWRGSPSAAV